MLTTRGTASIRRPRGQQTLACVTLAGGVRLAGSDSSMTANTSTSSR